MIDRLRAGATHATGAARQSLEETHLRHSLDVAYGQLGRATFELLERGAVTDRRFAGHAERIRELEDELARISNGASGRC